MKASLLVAAAVTVSVAAQIPARPAPVPAPVRPVVDTYHGVQVLDPYRWLERWDDSEVKAWTEAQNTHTHAQLDALPFMATLRARGKPSGLIRIPAGPTSNTATCHAIAFSPSGRTGLSPSSS